MRLIWAFGVESRQASVVFILLQMSYLLPYRTVLSAVPWNAENSLWGLGLLEEFEADSTVSVVISDSFRECVPYVD